MRKPTSTIHRIVWSVRPASAARVMTVIEPLPPGSEPARPVEGAPTHALVSTSYWVWPVARVLTVTTWPWSEFWLPVLSQEFDQIT